jgi:hypothetical protein
MTEFIDRAIAALAARQGGHVTRIQLLGLGLTPRMISWRIKVGRLIPVFYGVYAVGRLPTTPVDRAAGALLACGRKSVLSHGTAATVWGIRKEWRRPFEVTLIDGDRRPRGVRVHYCPSLARKDISIEYGLRVTSAARTVLDIAPRLPDRRLKRAIEDLRLQHRLKRPQLEDILERFPRHPGAGRLRRVTGTLQKEPTRSHWEDEWPPFAAQYKLPQNETNIHLCGHRVDVLFTPDLLIVELDGWDTHQTRDAFEADRATPAEIYDLTGIPTIRLTYEQLHGEPGKHAARLRRIIERERRREKRRPGESEP